MRKGTVFCLAATAALGAVFGAWPGGRQAAACDVGCGYGGYGYGSAYYAPDYSYYPVPAAVYTAPPVYSYSFYGPSAYDGYAPAYAPTYYYTRVNIFRGPRWDYSAAYYSPRRAYWRGRGGCHAPRVYHPCVRGAFIRASRRW
jgi:hypothetical protein